MSEFIVTGEQLERMIAAIEHDTSRSINRLVIDGVKQAEIVRCRDCVNMHEQPWNAITATGLWCINNDIPVNADGFCAWAERKEGGDD